MAKTSHNIKEWSQLGFEDFIAKTEIAAPHTEIVGRAKVKSGLSTSMGVERIPTVSLNLLNNESGPNGEPVYEADNKDARIRFVGAWFQQTDSTYGSRPQLGSSAPLTDFMEISFYGTGLNLLGADSVGVDLRATVDSGVESSDLTVSGSNILSSRNYNINNTIKIISGLSLGWHTVKLRKASGDIAVYGVQILNESTQIALEAGSAFSGTSKETLAALSYSDYNAGISGTKGARVVKYIQDNVVSQAVQEVDATALYLGSADHSNEEESRIYNWREFGANRADDFSTLAGSSNRAFTLDDGTTTLVGQAVGVGTGGDYVVQYSVGKVTITFIGTGLDIVAPDFGAGAFDSHNIYVDGVNIGSLVANGHTNITKRSICSGLPYGTHTVVFDKLVSAVNFFQFGDFIVYQPKTPELPTGARKLGSYNVMADYVANTVASTDTIGTGTLRKHCTREMTYVNSHSITFLIGGTNQAIGGWQDNFISNGAYLEYPFFGKGFEFRGRSNTSHASTVLVEVDGLVVNTTNFPSLVATTYGGFSFNPATGILDGNNSNNNGSGLSINGLGLGSHTLKVTNQTVSSFVFEALDIITPIYEPKSSLPYDLQSSMNVGSNNLGDVRENNLEVYKRPNIGQANGTIVTSTTSTIPIPCPEMVIPFYMPEDGFIEMYHKNNTSYGGLSVPLFQFYIDGTSTGKVFRGTNEINAGISEISGQDLVPLSKGFHLLQVYWYTSGGTMLSRVNERYFTVKQIIGDK